VDLLGIVLTSSSHNKTVLKLAQTTEIRNMVLGIILELLGLDLQKQNLYRELKTTQHRNKEIEVEIHYGNKDEVKPRVEFSTRKDWKKRKM